jgi:hypothetical protein
VRQTGLLTLRALSLQEVVGRSGMGAPAGRPAAT